MAATCRTPMLFAFSWVILLLSSIRFNDDEGWHMHERMMTLAYILRRYAQVVSLVSQLHLHDPLVSEPRLWASLSPTTLSYYFQEHVLLKLVVPKIGIEPF